MSNDLISRSEVLKTLEYIFNKYNMSWDKHGGFAEEVPESIRNLPTVYDVDVVVEQLEEKPVDCFKSMNLVKDEDGMEALHIYDEFYNQSKAYEDSIEIVKAGGVNE